MNQLAHGLLAIGVQQGDCVALSVGNRIEHLEIVFATAENRRVGNSPRFKWKALELGSVVAALEPRFIILQEECVEELERARSTRS